MNNKIKSIISIIFAIILTFSFGCSQTAPENVNNDYKYAKDANGNVISIVSNRVSDYKIVISDNAHEVEVIAAQELQKYIFESSKCNLPIVSEGAITIDEHSKILSVGQTNLLKQSNADISYALLGDDGTFVDVDGYKVFIAGAKPVGTVYAVYEFLEEVIGFEAYAVDEVYFDKMDSIKLVDFNNYTSIPAIQYRSPTYGDIKDPNEAKVLRLTGYNSLYGADWGVQVHSIEWFVTPETHPQWHGNGQLCFSNQEAMDYIANAIINKIPSMPNSRFWELGTADTQQYCTCDNCKAAAATYGGQAGQYVRWLNYIAEKVEKWQIENNIDREIWIIGLAYHAYAAAPAVKNADGTYSPIDSTVKCRDNVAIRYAPIEACYGHAINDPNCPVNGNGRFVEEIEKWNTLTNKLFLWLYSTEYYDYAFFMNDYGQLVDSYKTYRELGVYGIKDEMHACKRSPFSSLKLYLRSKLMWNPDLDMNELMDDFFVNYYKEAAPYMREYFEAIRSHFVKMSLPVAQGGYTQDGTYGCYLFNSGHGMVYYDSAYWNMDLLTKFEDIVKKAYKALQEAGYSDEEYESMRLRVRADEMFISHYYVGYYSNYFSEQEFELIKTQYDEDFVKLGMVKW